MSIKIDNDFGQLFVSQIKSSPHASLEIFLGIPEYNQISRSYNNTFNIF